MSKNRHARRGVPYQNNILAQKMTLSLRTKQYRQFMVLMTGDICINQTSLKHSGQHVVVANKHNDILSHLTMTHFDLILVDLTVNSLELIPHIKDPLCINNKTPVVAIINATETFPEKLQRTMELDDILNKPITEQKLNNVLNFWQKNALTLDYIQIMMNKTKNNPQLALTIFKKLFEELPLQVIAIKEAMKNKRYDLVQEISHKLNGSVSFCGLLDIQQSANALECCLLLDVQVFRFFAARFLEKSSSSSVL